MRRILTSFGLLIALLFATLAIQPVSAYAATYHRHWYQSRKAKIIGGSAAGGALIGALAGKGKGAAIGGLAGAGAGYVYERATRNHRR